ncbi:MAG: hypothetical protein ACOZF0_22490 [Thermodesulfobacteriota bacterium]
MLYEKTVALTGDGRRELEFAKTALAHAGHKLVRVTDTVVTAEQSGLFFSTTKGLAISGVSPITVTVADGRLTVRAGYEGLEKWKQFLIRFLVSLAVILGGGMGGLFAIVFEERWPMLLGIALGAGIPLLQLPIHLAITPFLLRRRAEKALDTFLHNIIMMVS